MSEIKANKLVLSEEEEAASTAATRCHLTLLCGGSIYFDLGALPSSSEALFLFLLDSVFFYLIPLSLLQCGGNLNEY